MTQPVKKFDSEGDCAQYACGEETDGGNVCTAVNTCSQEGYNTDLCE